jgi:CheY-like chemotaxis protein
VFFNLLDNALKFTPAGGTIAVAVRRDGEHAALSVKDTGRGISAELLPRVFELFVQGEQALDRSLGGLGLGLALVKRLAELHGGSVAAASDGPGKGATFTVRLPAVARPRVLPPAPARAIAGPRRVLIIEDNDDTRLMLRTALSLGGHEVREAASGAAGIAAAADAWAEIALVDIGLPDIDGYEVARRLRQTTRLRLVAVTGYGEIGQGHGQERQAREAAFDAYVVKPVSPERLDDVMARLP